jgi:hypothetical protein
MAIQKPLVIIDGAIQQIPAGDTLAGVSGGGIAISVVVDFGAEPVYSKQFDVAVPGAAVGQDVVITPSGRMPTGVDFDELEMDQLFAAGYVSASDTVTFRVDAIPGAVTGERRFNIQII